MPMDIFAPFARFTTPVFESGSKILSIVEYPKQKARDLTQSFRVFDIESIILFFIVHFILIFVQPLMLNKKKITFCESNFLLSKFILKQINFRRQEIKSNLIFPILSFYFLMIIAIVEQNNNTNLIVCESVDYHDDIDEIYQRKEIIPHLIKNHYVTG